MKRKIKAFLLCPVLFLAACSGGGESAQAVTVNNQQDVSQVIEDLAKKQEEEYSALKQAEAEAEADKAEPAAADENSTVRLMQYSGNVDVDLTEMNSTMIYSEVYNMMMDPVDYLGKTIRIYGMYTHYYEEASDTHYYACVVQDATACCAQGLEFVLVDDYIWPNDYPEDGAEIVVTGDFAVYQDSYFRVLTLENAVIEEYTPRVQG